VYKRAAIILATILWWSGLLAACAQNFIALARHQEMSLYAKLCDEVSLGLAALLFATLNANPWSPVREMRTRWRVALFLLGLYGLYGAWKAWHQLQLLASHGFLLR
jgi:hypothetical protein